VSDDWAAQRREAADAQAERAARNRATEVAAAQKVVDDFVATAIERGLATTELFVRAGDSSDTYRCGLVGWYVRRDGSVGVTPDGRMWTLSAPKSLKARLRGVVLEPTEPRLQAGIGGRDGESVALATLLELRLDAGDDWPIRR
jgi:hypothetical protein